MNQENIPTIEDLLQLPKVIYQKSWTKEPLSLEEIALLKQTGSAAKIHMPQIHSGVRAIGEMLAHSTENISQDSIHGIGWHLEFLGRLMHELGCLSESCTALLETNQDLRKEQNP